MGSVGKPPVQRISRSDPDGIIEAIFKDGCCIATDFTDVETGTKANEEVRPYLDADKPWQVSHLDK